MSLKETRKKIRHIDEEMAGLFEKRMELAEEVAAYKKKTGLAVEDLEQESHILSECAELIENEEIKPYYKQFLQSVMDISKRRQVKLIEGIRVAYCGDEKSLDYAAASSIFKDADLAAYDSYKEAYHAVETGECDAAVMPFENGYGDEIGSIIDLIFAGTLYVNAVHDIEIDPNEWGIKHNTNEETRRYAVLSPVENKNENKQDTGAFLLMFTVKDEAGGLAKAINAISVFNFNMRVMRSRPLKDHQWHYYFYAEAIGNDSSDNGKRMLTALRASCVDAKVVGRYPAKSEIIRIRKNEDK